MSRPYSAHLAPAAPRAGCRRMLTKQVGVDQIMETSRTRFHRGMMEMDEPDTCTVESSPSTKRAMMVQTSWRDKKTHDIIICVP
eukprot:scaffold26910_cov52-Attheya_sp.AAC.4